MYKQMKTDKEAILDNGDVGGCKFTPIATLANGESSCLAEPSGRCQIAIDDHCYVIYLRQKNGRYKATAWIFKEVFDVLKTLPTIEYSS